VRIAAPARVLTALVLLLPIACERGASERTPPKTGATAEPGAGSEDARCAELPGLVERMQRGFVRGRSPDILLVPREPNFIGGAGNPPHTGPWDYLVDVPLVFYGPRLRPRDAIDVPEPSVADIAPTVASLIGYDAPDGTFDGRSLIRPRGKSPRVVVVIVLDGIGRNVLKVHDNAGFLRWIEKRGVVPQGPTVGSSPSNTPPIHTTIGTGVFPQRHGIPHVRMRTANGDYVDPFEGNVADALRVPTLADLYDPTTDNRSRVGLVATVNWHLGMIGSGLDHPGGDADEVVLLNDAGAQYGNASVYGVPTIAQPGLLAEEVERFDSTDGERDGRWGHEDLGDLAIRYMSPAYVRYQQRMLVRTLERGDYGADEIPDLMYVNFKAADAAGHRWGMSSDQVGQLVATEDAAVRATAFALGRLVPDGRWILVVTADHGMTPYPKESGGWPVRGSEVRRDLEREFGRGSVTRVTTAGIFVDEDADPRRMGRWLADYAVADNLVDDQTLPGKWRGRAEEPLFDIVMAGSRVIATSCEDD
jgi:hypothetical protein